MEITMFDETLLLLIFPIIHIVLIGNAVRISLKRKPQILYHRCKKTSVAKIFRDKKFKTKTEGRAYFSPNPNNKLGVENLPVRDVFMALINFIKLLTRRIPLIGNLITPTQPSPPKGKIALANVVFEQNALNLLKPIFKPFCIFSLFNIWGAIKSLRNEWVSKSLYDITLVQCHLDTNGNCIVTDAVLKKKEGKDYYFSLCKVIGMVFLNLNISLSVVFMTITCFLPQYYIFLVVPVCFLLISLLVIFIWFVKNQTSNK